MIDLVASEPHLATRPEVVASLWLIVAGPLFATVMLVADALGARRGALPRVSALALALTGMFAAFAATAAHAVALYLRAPDAGLFYAHGWGLVRIGQLDASFDIVFDRLAAVVGLVAPLLGAMACFANGSTGERDRATSLACVSAGVTGLLVAAMAENLIVLAIGWQVTALAVWASAHRDGRAALVVTQVGSGLLLVASALLFWGLGGAWTASRDYVPELEPRFAAVRVPDRAGAVDAATRSALESDPEPRGRLLEGAGYLTLTAYSGATVYVDDAQRPLADAAGNLAHAPFVRVPIAGGTHSFRIHPGGGADDFLVAHVEMGGGREVVLQLFGPTLSFAGLAAQLAVRDDKGAAIAADAIAARPLGELGEGGFVAAVVLLFVAASAIRLASPHARAAGAITGAVLLVRVGPLVRLRAIPTASLVVVGVIVALVAALAASRAPPRSTTLTERLAWVARELDDGVLDALLGAVVVAVRALAWTTARVDSHLVDGGVRAFGASALAAAQTLERAEGARARRHVVALLTLVGGSVALYYTLLKK